MLEGFGRLFAQVQAVDKCLAEAQQFPIDTAGGVDRPTPEEAHRDGVNFFVVLLVALQGVRNDET